MLKVLSVEYAVKLMLIVVSARIHIDYVHVDGITNHEEPVEVVKEQLTGSEEQVHKCSHCGIEYSQYLKIHMLFNVDKQTRFSCKTCIKTFASLKSLENHIAIHTHKHSHDTGEEKQCKVPTEKEKQCKIPTEEEKQCKVFKFKKVTMSHDGSEKGESI